MKTQTERKVYQVVLPGYNGSTDETDHLIKWVASHSISQVSEKYPGCKVETTELNPQDAGIDLVI